MFWLFMIWVLEFIAAALILTGLVLILRSALEYLEECL